MLYAGVGWELIRTTNATTRPPIRMHFAKEEISNEDEKATRNTTVYNAIIYFV